MKRPIDYRPQIYATHNGGRFHPAWGRLVPGLVRTIRNAVLRAPLLIGLGVLADAPAGKPHGNVILERFPDEPRLFCRDVQAAKDTILQRHGREEWELVVLTSEMHTHLGIYSIIGAKMGLRAREYFGAGKDEFTVVSYAGNRPPVSCLADGLQVSTGATLGHGTITVATGQPPAPKAQFTFGGQVVVLQLKPKYWQQIRQDIAGLIEQHGPTSEAYWQAVRELGIQYWRDWSRQEMFDVEAGR